jgi:hypothetical protein
MLPVDVEANSAVDCHVHQSFVDADYKAMAFHRLQKPNPQQFFRSKTTIKNCLPICKPCVMFAMVELMQGCQEHLM